MKIPAKATAHCVEIQKLASLKQFEFRALRSPCFDTVFS
jgi:hypothetical protein